jgi:hypothetical protein
MIAIQEQVFPVHKAEQRQRGKGPGGIITAEHDGAMGLNLAEFGRDGDAGHHIVAQCGAEPGVDAQGAMIGGVQDLVAGHGWTMAPVRAVK